MPSAVIQTHVLTKRYGSARGIEDVTLTVRRGEVFGFLGPNGAGKTTMIRTLLDLQRTGAQVIATQVDGTLLVLKGGETSRDAAVRTTRALLDVKARVFGAVLNDLDLEDARYGEYYYYYRSGYYRDGDVKAEAKPKVA
jgi:ABC-type multidrug transport system ATPase subunit